MKIALKLYASLTDLLPPERIGNRLDVEVPAGTTVSDMVVRYRVPERSAHLVLINGVFVSPEQRATRELADGDELAIWPPIAGG
ncbi:MAG TPA: MoaD/ThiS family protein [Rhodocyclaceae bacterium]|jgi:sulfur carrier protein ThiS|nr:MoaD/ThiS family protein [Rhodocyclaceae bacterium]HRQ45668.1 MoaD/ThiS family protein [Rhodocyclaceae bacterium]